MGSEGPLTSIRRAAFDTSPFIYLIEGEGHRGERAAVLFEQLLSATKVTSIVTPIEILTFCQGPAQQGLGEMYRQYFRESDVVSVWPADWRIVEETARLRAAHTLRTPDAIQLATAIVAGAEVFITNDRRFPNVPEVRLIIFDDWTP